MDFLKPELLAPAGSLESIYAAVRCGADAVYVGGRRFSARGNAVNFTASELSEAVKYCHLHNVKVYQAMNTLVFDDEISDFVNDAIESARAGIDALIIQDIGMARVLKKVIPDMKLHASTQMTIHTKKGAEMALQMGFSRVVLSRELSLAQIAKICTVGIETEVFVHGALCMSVSGQCFMSAMIGSRSANRGLCAQACRLPFSAIDGDVRYDLSLKDLSVVDKLDLLADVGVTSFKIEGRMKRAEYVAASVLACRQKIDGEIPDLDTLKAIFSRSGFTDGYLTGNLGSEMFGIRQKEDVVAAESVLPDLRERFRKETKAVSADFRINIKNNENSVLTMKCGELSVCADGEIPQIANNRPSDLESVKKQLSKLGDTVYECGDVSADIDDGLVLSASALNALRRDVALMMDELRIQKNTPMYNFNNFDNISNENSFSNSRQNTMKKDKEIYIRIQDSDLLNSQNSELLHNNHVKYIILPFSECRKIKGNPKIIIDIPRFVFDENDFIKNLTALKENGFSHLLCNNISHIKIGRDLGFVLHGGFGLNITNSQSAALLNDLGLVDYTASFECKINQIDRISANLHSADGMDFPVGAVVYGYLPLMLTVNCPVKQAVGGCRYCTGQLIDRTGRCFYVRCEKNSFGEYSEILNSDLLLMSDRIKEVNTDFIILDFHDENLNQINDTINSYISGLKMDGGEFTRGLYYRGII